MNYSNTVQYSKNRMQVAFTLLVHYRALLQPDTVRQRVSDEIQHRNRATLPASAPTPHAHRRRHRPSPAY